MKQFNGNPASECRWQFGARQVGKAVLGSALVCVDLQGILGIYLFPPDGSLSFLMPQSAQEETDGPFSCVLFSKRMCALHYYHTRELELKTGLHALDSSSSH